eukprot:620283-Prymnesium_polylepis.2
MGGSENSSAIDRGAGSKSDEKSDPPILVIEIVSLETMLHLLGPGVSGPERCRGQEHRRGRAQTGFCPGNPARGAASTTFVRLSPTALGSRSLLFNRRRASRWRGFVAK